MHPVIYFTGPPASGKTTVLNEVARVFPEARILEYSELLAKHLERKHSRLIEHKELRESSAQIITPADVAEVDDALISRCSDLRQTNPVIIASHPATREKFGFRVIMFSPTLLKKLNPTALCMLYSSSETIAERVQSNADGRPVDTEHQIEVHRDIQVSIATTYAFNLGIIAYFFDSNGDARKVVPSLVKLLKGSV